VLPAEHLPLPRADYPGSTIMPGLIDSHVHLAFDGGPNPAARMRAETGEQQLMLMLRSARELLGVGVTTARDLGSRGYLAVAVRDAIAAGLARGPRLVVAACPITVTGGHCWFMGGEADSEDDLRHLVRTHHKNGADLIKVMSTVGFMTSGSAPWYAQFTTAQARRHRRGSGPGRQAGRRARPRHRGHQPRGRGGSRYDRALFVRHRYQRAALQRVPGCQDC
jgi:imidazolonepropionase-like amidohydrolase